ncbi:archaellin/type IV pilin N-terminal domain-containing protein [Halopiger goleimassiliensis]|uniref:archaellin/type IV pilin N-terminal domain-containing protein n=1 Tax=Halopiger goleimassiliensis TaxID=1293048 RepID=UPI000678072F|nr:archaellin/type IV pilin N-terminal domain-containing protein [Halopiger goleimassiliensis]
MTDTFTPYDSNDRGQVGIGVLIIFIAMVLVAAIAAGVVIDTGGMLQAQAEATGEESTELVSERLTANTAVGIVGDEANGDLTEIRVGVSAAPGASEINLVDTVVQVTGPGGQENLVYASDPASPDGDEFVAMDLDMNPVGRDDAVLNNENREYILVFDAESEPFANEDGPMGESQDATLDIVSPSSAVTSVELSAPDLFQKDGQGVRL